MVVFEKRVSAPLVWWIARSLCSPRSTFALIMPVLQLVIHHACHEPWFRAFPLHRWQILKAFQPVFKLKAWQWKLVLMEFNQGAVLKYFQSPLEPSQTKCSFKPGSTCNGTLDTRVW